MSEVLILSQKEVAASLPMQRVIDAVRSAYISFSSGRVQIAPVVHLDVAQYNGELDIKSGFVEDFNLIGTKIASGYYDNHKLGLPPGVAVIVLMDLRTSMPVAIIDGTYITATRTGAAGAVAASVLAREESSIIGVIGAGTQGRMQVAALNELFSLTEVRIWDKFEDSAKGYAAEMSEKFGIGVIQDSNPMNVVRGADIIVTATPSREAIVKNDWIHEGVHINAIGADGEGKQELDPYIIKRADKVVVDSLSQCRRIGEIQHALRMNLIGEHEIYAEIGQILNGEKLGRESNEEITLFDSTGIAALDIAAANIAVQQAKEKGIGKTLKLLDM
ncbi:MAG: ornithine cyclodeaminase family protein [Candidatus Thorarchaeota archaeon]